MLLMLIGAFLAMVSLTIPLGGVSVDVLPDFVGYLLIAAGMGQLEQVPIYDKGRKVALLAALVSVGILVMGMLGVKLQLYILCSLLGLGIGSWATWIIALGLVELEQQVGIPFNGEKLKIPWMIYVTVSVLGYWTMVAGMSGVTDMAELYAIIVILAPAAAVFYAILLFSGWRGYVDYQKKSGGLTR